MGGLEGENRNKGMCNVLEDRERERERISEEESGLPVDPASDRL